METTSKVDKKEIHKITSEISKLHTKIDKAAVKTSSPAEITLDVWIQDDCKSYFAELKKLAKSNPSLFIVAMDQYIRKFAMRNKNNKFNLWYSYVYPCLRDYPQVGGEYYGKLINDDILSPDLFLDMIYESENLFDVNHPRKYVSEEVFLKYALIILEDKNDYINSYAVTGRNRSRSKIMPDGSRKHIIEERRKTVIIPMRKCDCMQQIVCGWYYSNELEMINFIGDDLVEKYQDIANRDPLIEQTKKFLLKRQSRIAATKQIKQILEQHAALQMSPAEFDSLEDSWQKLADNSNADDLTIFALDLLFKQIALNTTQEVDKNNKAITLHLAKKVTDAFAKDGIILPTFTDKMLRDKDESFFWFYNTVMEAIYGKHQKTFSPVRGEALKHIVNKYKDQFDKNTLFVVEDQP